MSSLPSSADIHGTPISNTNQVDNYNFTDLESKLKTFIDRQRELLQLERNAEIERTSLLLSNCSPKLLEQKGLALLGLGIASVGVGLGGKTLVELDRPSAYHTSPIFPPHTFRNGDLARIEAHTSSSTAASGTSKKSKAKGPSAPSSSASGDVSNSAVEGVVYKVSDTRIVVAVDPDGPGNSNIDDLPDRCRVVKLANSVTYDRMDKAIDRLEKTVLPSTSGGSSNYTLTPLAQVLLGMKPLSRPNPNAIKDITFFNPNLNESQKEALRFCLSAPEVACIHGPPGTGKTHTLIELIRQLTKPTSTHPNGQRLLVCGASNLAVDNILERLLDLDDAWPGVEASGSDGSSEKSTIAKKSGDRKLKVTRIGHPARIMAHPGILESTLEVKSTRTEQAALVKDIKQELESILGTLSGKGSSKGGSGGSSKAGVKGAGGAKDKPVGTQRASKPGARPRGAERKKMWEEVKALRKEFRTRESSIVTSVLSQDSQVVLSTCHSAGGRQLNNLPDFDVVIIDEATQAMEAVTWIPIFKAKKLILAGDPMQLPPTVLSLGDERRKLEKKTKTATVKAKETKGDGKKEQKKGSSGANPTKKDKKEGEDPEEDENSSEGGDDEEMDDAGSEAEDPPAPSDATNAKPANQTNKISRPTRIPELIPPHSLEVTLFERLEKMYGRNVKRMLTVQYRMHKQICDFPSRTLYRSKLRSHASVSKHLLKDLAPDASEEDSEEILQHPVLFFDTAGCEFFERLESEEGSTDSNIGGKLRSRLDEGSRCNENEAGIVKAWVEKLVGAGIEPGQIAVITPYQAQVTLLTSLLRPVYGPSLEIGTVDGMQGREKEAVVISLVRSNDKREVGFLKEKRRMNVAMTRAKRHLCVVGDSSTVVHGGGYLKKWIAWLEANADIRFPDV